MATPGSRLEAVLRAGQAQLAPTGGGLPYAKASWRMSKADMDALEAERRKQTADADYLYTLCVREMTEAQGLYKRSVRPEKLALWEWQGRAFADPAAVALAVYHRVMNGEEYWVAWRYIQDNVEQSLYPPPMPSEGRARADEEDVPVLDAWEYEEDVPVLDAWECEDTGTGTDEAL